MADKKLVAYIREQLQSGYSLTKIKNHLIKHGYKKQEVEKAVNVIYRPDEVRHVIHFSPVTLIVLASIFVIAIATFGFFYFFDSPGTPQQLLDLNLEPVTSTAKQGENIVFIVDILNLGSGARYDVFLKHELISLRTNKVVTFKEETKGIETSGSSQTRISIPTDAEPGDYVLRTIATYNGQRAVATLQVNVKEDEVTEQGIEEPEVEETPSEQEPEITEPIIEEPEVEPVKDGNLEGLSSFEVLERIKEIAKTDKSKAADLCQTLALQTSRDLCYNSVGEIASDRTYCTLIQDERTRDICFSNVARILKKSEICESISKDSRKDSCYMNFVVDFRDYSVCDNVINQYLKQSCNSLKQLSELNSTNIVFYESLINRTLLSFG
jgi:hypothetical protein